MFAAVIYPSRVSGGLDGQGNYSFVTLAAADNQVISPKTAAKNSQAGITAGCILVPDWIQVEGTSGCIFAPDGKYSTNCKT